MGKKYPNREKLKEYLRWRLSLSDEEFAKYVQERKREWKEEWKESFKDLKVYPGDFRLLERLFGEEVKQKPHPVPLAAAEQRDLKVSLLTPGPLLEIEGHFCMFSFDEEGSVFLRPFLEKEYTHLQIDDKYYPLEPLEDDLCKVTGLDSNFITAIAKEPEKHLMAFLKKK